MREKQINYDDCKASSYGNWRALLKTRIISPSWTTFKSLGTTPWKRPPPATYREETSGPEHEKFFSQNPACSGAPYDRFL